jgi:hypothetical protein
VRRLITGASVGVDNASRGPTIVAGEERIFYSSGGDSRSMKWNLAEPRNRPRLIASMILLVGFGSAIVIYLKAGTVPGTPLEFSADSSKKYLRDLQLYGGTANVLAVQLMDWFKGLWHGRSLAFTVAIITVAVCLGYLFFAVLLPRYPSEEPPGDGESNRQPRG